MHLNAVGGFNPAFLFKCDRCFQVDIMRILNPVVLVFCLCGMLAGKVLADIAIQNPDSRNAILLDGRWDTILDPYENGVSAGYFKNAKASSSADLVEYDFSASPKLNVPGDWNTQDEKLFWYEGSLWYHRDFDIAKKTDLQYLLYFGAVNYSANIYLNGKEVGVHEGGFTPFQFDISALIKVGSNSLVVKVDNRRERDQIPAMNTDWWNYGGITRSVKVLQVPAAHIDDYFIQMGKGAKPEIEGWVKVSFNSAAAAKNTEAQKVELRIPELNITQKIVINKNGEGEFVIPAKPVFWTPEQPKLYAVELVYQQEIIHDKIGFRTLQVQGENILLNGKSIFLKGINIHEESPFHAGRAWSEEDAHELLRWAKELGCNFVRLAHYPHSETMVRMADQMGLMVWSEIPVYWTVLFNNPTVYNKAEDQLEEMIARDKNRAAVIMWSLANETPNSASRLKFIGQLAQKARELDDTRLITAALNTQSDEAGAKVIDDPLANIIDVVGINNYCGWYVGAPASCAKLKWLSHYHKPVIMSEFGADALQGNHGDKGQRWTEEYQADVYANNLAMIDAMPFVRGIAPWVLRDFRSPRRPLPNIQDFWNRKGLIADNGNKKKAWHIVHDYYQKKPEERTQ